MDTISQTKIFYSMLSALYVFNFLIDLLIQHYTIHTCTKKVDAFSKISWQANKQNNIFIRKIA